jgi:CRP/FNR family transcriptional regulator, cyclic AMP receptor protein
MQDVERLDLRGLPVWERPARVLEVFDRLPAGQSVLLITENEPRGLGTRIEQSRKHELILDPRRVGDREWHVSMTRATIEIDAPSPMGVLKRSLVFSQLDDSTRQKLAAVATLHTARRGQTVVTENSDWPFIGVAFEGVFALSSRNGTARQRIFYEIFPYEIFGEIELFDGAPTVGRVIVLSKAARYLRLPTEAVLQVAEHSPKLYAAFGRVAAQRVRDLAELLVSQNTLPIIARIAQVLLPYAMPEKGLSAAMAPLPNMTQAQIAAAAGTVKEVAARAIAELELKKLLKRERGHVRYLDRQALLDLIRESS